MTPSARARARPAPLRLALPRQRGDAPLLRGPAGPAAGARDQSDHVPSTGEFCPYVHIFFQMRDGSYIAFFDLGDDVAALPSPNTPAWVNHIALRVDSVGRRCCAAKARLEAAGVEVLGVTDHHIIESIYFFDPNGIRARADHADRAAGRDGRARAARPRRPATPGRARKAELRDGKARAWLSCNSPSSTSSPAPRWRASRACRCCARASTAPTARRPARRRSRRS